ncbi:MAG: rhomboid family intramembrane serine protease [Flavobacteriaceae bacterium]|nr:rhomboid family intramembrane serine protease [Flavobacteriaceae bacterium]RCL66599.1 MAG: rhomboid family intramembrane serine protease [Cryomorphaceae bacterium]|tara:strand:- start:2704 stop:3564 length:861 start_codon:yes stop_codon:yes gene_type:complete
MELINSLKYKYDNLNILSQIIVWMIICFIVPFILNTFLFLFNISPYSIIDLFQVSPSISELFFKPWSLITYGFFHADLWHLLGNMIILYFSGRVVLDLFGKEKFLKIFLIGLLFGSLTYLISYNLFPVFKGLKPPMIGASAGAMAVFVFLAAYMPHYSFRLVLFDVKILYIAIFFIIVDVIQIPFGNSGGHLAHLGGAAWGYFYNSQLSKGKDSGDWLINFINYLKYFFNKKTKVRKVYKKKNYKKNSNQSIDQKKIDLILDKISKSGYDSLTKSEKETLFKAGEN